MKELPSLRPPEEKPIDIQKLVRDAFFDTTQKFPAPPVAISFIENAQENMVLTLGNLSTIGGKAKSRKSSFANIMLASFITSEAILSKIKSSLPLDQKGILYFDTEQTAYHLSICTDRIKKVAGILRFPNYFKVYRLRKFSPAERLKIIQTVIEESTGVGFVLIDGIRDLLSKGINDEAEATKIVSELMRLSEEKNVHIMLVLHQNKGEARELRGHIGSELINKSETIFDVKKDESNPLTSLILSQYSRNSDFKEFSIDFKDEIPIILESHPGLSKGKSSKRSKGPYDYDIATHYNAAKGALSDPKGYGYTEAWRTIKLEFEKHGNGFGENVAKAFLTYYQKEGLVIQGDKKRYFFNDQFRI